MTTSSSFPSPATRAEAVCWWSWEAQKRSLAKLLDFELEWLLPGHDGRMRAPSKHAMRTHLQAAIERAERS